MKWIVEGARRAGPYLLVELILPGGSLIALAMLIVAYRRNLRTRNPAVGGPSTAAA